ncbi:1-(5-phosphoribosyl)-5-[(5-phosphoribosylamino)methylideneamino] imidazole-4-carboxamide isomerase [subsurface metagenome]
MKASNQKFCNQMAKERGSGGESLTTSPSHVKKRAKRRYCSHGNNNDMIIDKQEGDKTTIEIIPGIDIRQGKCVRLYQGDYARETIYSDDPVEVALEWQSLGAPRLHIVDLDGAAKGELCNLDIIAQIASTILVPTQLGGGIRDLETLKQLLKAGIERVILSTAAVEDPMLVKEACRSFSESIIVGLDTWEGYIAIRGWQQQTELKAIEFAKSMVELGVRRFIYTDISRDGTLTEPNLIAIGELVNTIRLPISAAGGISSLSHLGLLRQFGVEGAIVGKALYTGDINLKQALATVS